VSGLLENAIAAVHHLSAAAWFGALVYRTFFVDPKALRFFGAGAEFERYSLDLADGMRYVVMAALVTCGLTGFALVGLRWNWIDQWLTLMAVKTGFWAIAFALFGYISWVFWPRRVFAVAGEWPSVRRRGFILSLVMVAIASLGFILGQLAQALRHGSIVSA